MSLDKAWPSLSDREKKMVCEQVAHLLVNTFSFESPSIYTSRWSRSDGAKDQKDLDTFILAPPFNHGPLVDVDPVDGARDVSTYLKLLAERIDRIFDSPTAVIQGEVAKLGWHNKDKLTFEDVTKIRRTWYRLKELIPYNAGGCYLPSWLLDDQRTLALSILQNKTFGIRHPELHMSRIIVNTQANEVSICVYGWEHAFYAPLWSCAQMPTWLLPNCPQRTPVPLTGLEQIEMSRLVYETISNLGTENALYWVVAYVFGRVERAVENCLSAHWMWSDAIEVILAMVKECWEATHPKTPFPIEVPLPCSRDGVLAQPSMQRGDGSLIIAGNSDPSSAVQASTTPAILPELTSFRPMKGLPRKSNHH